MKNKKISSDFDRMVIDVLKSLVPDQKMKLIDEAGNTWESKCKDVGGMAITIITFTSKFTGHKNIVAKVVYDYESNEEKIFGGDDE